MSTLTISDLSFLEELDSQEAKISGAASAVGVAAANYNDALAGGASTTNGYVYGSANGSYNSSYYSHDRYGYYSSYYSSGPSIYLNAQDRRYY